MTSPEIGASDSSPLVITETHASGVLELALNRPAALNALSVEFVRAIGAAAKAAAMTEPTVVVLTSRCPRAFSVGADLKERATMTSDDLIACRPDFLGAYRAFLDLPFPVLAAVEGFAVGGGLELALTCDLIVADATTQVGLPEVTIGLIPGGGGSQLLGRRTGWGPAADLILTGRRLAADEAFSLRVVDRVVPGGSAREHALALAQQMAAASPNSLTLAKAALRGGWGKPLDDALAIEDSLWTAAALSADRAEGISAFVERRPPRWPSSRTR